MKTLTSNGQALVVVAVLILVYVLAGPALNIIATEDRDSIIAALMGFIGGGATGKLLGRS